MMERPPPFCWCSLLLTGFELVVVLLLRVLVESEVWVAFERYVLLSLMVCT